MQFIYIYYIVIALIIKIIITIYCPNYSPLRNSYFAYDKFSCTKMLKSSILVFKDNGKIGIFV